MVFALQGHTFWTFSRSNSNCIHFFSFLLKFQFHDKWNFHQSWLTSKVNCSDSNCNRGSVTVFGVSFMIRVACVENFWICFSVHGQFVTYKNWKERANMYDMTLENSNNNSHQAWKCERLFSLIFLSRKWMKYGEIITIDGRLWITEKISINITVRWIKAHNLNHSIEM